MIIDRLKEGSSWAAIAATIAAVAPGLAIPQPYYAAITAICGAIAFFLKDKK